MSFLFGGKKKKTDNFKAAVQVLQKTEEDFENQADLVKQAKQSLALAEGLYKKVTQASKRAQVMEAANTMFDAADKYYHCSKGLLEEFWAKQAENPITPSSPSTSSPAKDPIEKEKAKKEAQKKAASQQMRNSLFGDDSDEGSAQKPNASPHQKSQTAILEGQDIETPDEKKMPKIAQKKAEITDGTPYLAQIPGARTAIAAYKKGIELLLTYGNETSQAAKASVELGKICGDYKLFDEMYDWFSKAIDYLEAGECYTSANVTLMECAQYMAYPCKQYEKAIKFYEKMMYADWNKRSRVGTGEKFMMTSHRNPVLFEMFLCKILVTITPIDQLAGVTQLLEEIKSGIGMEFGNNFDTCPECQLLARVLQAFVTDTKQEDRTKKFGTAYKNYASTNTVSDWVKKMLLAVKEHLNYCFTSQDGLE